MPQPNELLRAARERTPSRWVPSESMSRSELADAVCRWLREQTQKDYDLDGRGIARYERGEVLWPGAAYRSALRHLLGAAHDEDLGFRRPMPASRRAPQPTRSGNVETLLLEAASESSRFLHSAEATNVGELTVEQLVTQVRRISHSYLKVPTLPLFQRTRAVRDRAFLLLAGRQRPHQTRDLYAAAGWALTMLAWMSVDLGRADAAEDHAQVAWACAENAGQPGLRGWVRATQHTVLFWQDRYTEAAGYAEDGLRHATGTAATFLASARALDLARAGDHTAAREALDDGPGIAEHAQPERDEMGGPFTCSLDRAGSLWSDTHLALGDADRALTLARQAVARFEATPRDRRNLGSERMVRIQVVKAHLVAGELDGAAEALAPVLATSPEHRVRPLRQRVGEVRVMATRAGRADPAAGGMLAAIDAFDRQSGGKITA